MKIISVDSDSLEKAFLTLPIFIYKNDHNWVRPLDKMITSVFNREQNGFFKHGDAHRWLVFDDNDQCVGRIAAFYDEKKAFTFSQPTGGVGFFESVDDQKVADLLFDTAKEWLTTQGMQAMDGPINFGENMVNWGLLVDGFHPQTFGIPYNPKYYELLFENYGFKTYYEQYCYRMNISEGLNPRLMKIAQWISRRPGYHFGHMKFDNLEKYVNDFMTIYSKAWRSHDNFKGVDVKEIKEIGTFLKRLADEKYFWFAYKDDEPIAFFAMIPDWNQILKHLNGKINIYSIIKFLYLRRKKTITRARCFVMGVVPEFQGSGVESAIFAQLEKVLDKQPWMTELEFSWVGDFNPKMELLYQSVGGKKASTLLTMRYLFDPSKSFERAPILHESMKDKAKGAKN
ncbi:GNAT family N-acetyltransferase [Halosquirtibacter xylanolyticus]|uniref:GNAT family N-acetyltransferase n=1 Tax=Halosquirtibacter xylanolyticus TaxID=3374599 RepID=UPI003748D6D9|nr:GNAT family N-acetyltransferase [Prolixibacteraceae bacterium]